MVLLSGCILIYLSFCREGAHLRSECLISLSHLSCSMPNSRVSCCYISCFLLTKDSSSGDGSPFLRAASVQIVIWKISPLLPISRAFSRYASVVRLMSSFPTPFRNIIISRMIGTVSECQIVNSGRIAGLWNGASAKSVKHTLSTGRLFK